MRQYKLTGNLFKFRPEEKHLYIFLIALLIFILGVQLGIKQGRALELDDLRIKYGYEFTD